MCSSYTTDHHLKIPPQSTLTDLHSAPSFSRSHGRVHELVDADGSRGYKVDGINSGCTKANRHDSNYDSMLIQTTGQNSRNATGLDQETRWAQMDRDS